MKAFFSVNGVEIETETSLDAPTLSTLWTCAVKHGCHVQVPIKKSDGRVRLLNIRSLNCDRTFGDQLVPASNSIPPSE
jgi:hypothetical protein